MKRGSVLQAFGVVVVAAFALAGHAQPCAPTPSPEFSGDALDFAPSAVNAFIDFNDGSGFKTYACGAFTTAGGQPAHTVARWTGTAWERVGPALAQPGAAPVGTGKCFAVFNNALYMGGQFGSSADLAIAALWRWTGTTWQPVLDGPRAGSVNAMTTWNDGTGNALYAVGSFFRVGEANIRCIIRWNGAAWTPVGTNFPPANSVAVGNAVIGFTDSLGPGLYVAGQFSNFSSVIAKWDRTTWTTGNGPSVPLATQGTALHIHADTMGTAIWLAVAPTSSGQLLYRYNGSSRFWQVVNQPGFSSGGRGLSLTSYNDGTGNALYLGGEFLHPTAAGGSARNLIKHNGTTFSAVGPDSAQIFGPVTALGVRTGTNVGLLAGGISQIGTQPIPSVALWNGSTFSGLGSGITNPGVRQIEFYPEDPSAALHALGTFTGVREPSPQPLNSIARWNGSDWNPLAAGVNGGRFTTVIGNTLYVGGNITLPGSTDPASAIAAWNGSAWSIVPTPPNFEISAATTFDDGQGPELCVAGRVNFGPTSVQVLRNGSWVQLGSPFGFSSTVSCLRVLEGDLYAAGEALQGTAGVPGARVVARWTGAAWEMLPAGPVGGVIDLALFDGSLYACGPIYYYDVPIFQRSATLAKLTDDVWTYPTTGLTGTPYAMIVWNDGTGDALYLAGDFTDAARGITNLARLHGDVLEPFGGAIDGPVRALRVRTVGRRQDLYAGGSFSIVGGPSPGVARWEGCEICVADVDNGNGRGTRDGGVTIDDLIYYLTLYAEGNRRADLDDGSGTGTPDGGVTVDDLLYYLARYAAGC